MDEQKPGCRGVLAWTRVLARINRRFGCRSYLTLGEADHAPGAQILILHLTWPDASRQDDIVPVLDCDLMSPDVVPPFKARQYDHGGFLAS